MAIRPRSEKNHYKKHVKNIQNRVSNLIDKWFQNTKIIKKSILGKYSVKQSSYNNNNNNNNNDFILL